MDLHRKGKHLGLSKIRSGVAGRWGETGRNDSVLEGLAKPF